MTSYTSQVSSQLQKARDLRSDELNQAAIVAGKGFSGYIVGRLLIRGTTAKRRFDVVAAASRRSSCDGHDLDVPADPSRIDPILIDMHRTHAVASMF